MNTKNANHPVDTLRDGSLKATIWRNEGEKGPHYSVSITRTWRDEQGDYHDSDSFAGSELLRIARLANIAYDEIVIHRENDRKQQA
ncbi:MAG: hypothetical protein IT431_11680 [Phycisphaerales bacterium]|nr:hypothetical protein [Phycisphaerales bacterium]